MSSDEFIKSFGSYAAIVGAIVGVWTAIFVFLNWRKSIKQDMPYAYLVKYVPDKDGLLESDIVVENRSLSDIFINIIKLECGRFSGDHIPDGMEGESIFLAGKPVSQPPPFSAFGVDLQIQTALILEPQGLVSGFGVSYGSVCKRHTG